MRRSSVFGVVALGLVVLVAIGCAWQSPRLARLGLGLRAEVGPVDADGSVTAGLVMPSVWGARRCYPDLGAPRRTHRTYPGTLSEAPDSLVGEVNGDAV